MWWRRIGCSLLSSSMEKRVLTTFETHVFRVFMFYLFWCVKSKNLKLESLQARGQHKLATSVRSQVTLGAEHVTCQGPHVPFNWSRCHLEPVSHCQGSVSPGAELPVTDCPIFQFPWKSRFLSKFVKTLTPVPHGSNQPVLSGFLWVHGHPLDCFPFLPWEVLCVTPGTH